MVDLLGGFGGGGGAMAQGISAPAMPMMPVLGFGGAPPALAPETLPPALAAHIGNHPKSHAAAQLLAEDANLRLSYYKATASSSHARTNARTHTRTWPRRVWTMSRSVLAAQRACSMRRGCVARPCWRLDRARLFCRKVWRPQETLIVLFHTNKSVGPLGEIACAIGVPPVWKVTFIGAPQPQCTSNKMVFPSIGAGANAVGVVKAAANALPAEAAGADFVIEVRQSSQHDRRYRRGSRVAAS